MSECTTNECANPTSTYLCGQCTSDLQSWLDKVPELVADLAVTVAKLDKITPVGGGGGGGQKPGSKAPLNIGAFQVRWYLSAVSLDAKDHAKDPDAATIAENIRAAVDLAEQLILGAPDKRVITTCQCGGKVISSDPIPQPTDKDPNPDDSGTCVECGRVVTTNPRDQRMRILDRCPSGLRSKDALEWIAEHAGIHIASTDVRNWAREKKITRTNPDEAGHPKYHVADILRVHFRNADTGKRREQHAV